MRHFLVFILAFFLSSIIYHLSSNSVGAATFTVCPDAAGGCQYTGAKGIQDAIESAADGDIISVSPGNYVSTAPIVTDPDYKFQTCLIHTRKKSITINGAGAVIDNQNGGLDDPTQSKWSTGICVIGGTVTINGIAVKQTLRPALAVHNAQAIVKNFRTIDIDNVSIDAASSNIMVFNSLFTGGGISIRGNSFARIENNTIVGGIILTLCNATFAGEIKNNVLVSGITATCPEQIENKPDVKISNNIVFKNITTGDASCLNPDNGAGECGAGEICTGATYVWPGFIGADEKGTTCVWGEGWIQGDFNTKPGSAATVAGAGISTGPCAGGESAGCLAYINNNAFPTPTPEPTEAPQPITNPGNTGTGGQGQSSFRSGGNITNIKSSIEYVLNNLKLTNEGTKETNGMDLVIYVAASVVYIMVIHFAVGIKSEFNIFLMIIYFVLGGIIGGWMNTYEGGLALSIILSLLFI
jgi:hypothetical protein